jgi:predicted ATP-dependent protease
MNEPRHALELTPDQLRRLTDPATLGFTSTQNLLEPATMAGQRIAQEAIEFALEIRDNRYNLYAAGPAGTGRRLAVSQAVERAARARSAPRDWCYVANFEQMGEPRALALPAGSAKRFAEDVDAFVQAARRALRQAYSADDYVEKRSAIARDFQARRDQILSAVQQQTLALGFAVRLTENGIAIVPVTRATPAAPPSASMNNIMSALRGQPPYPTPGPAPSTGDTGDEPTPMSREQLSRLSPAERQRLEANESQVSDIVDRTLVPQLRQAQESARARIRALDREVGEHALSTVGAEITTRYDAADAKEFFHALRADLVAHAQLLRATPNDSASSGSQEDGDNEKEDAESAGTGGLDDNADETPAELAEESEDDPKVRFFLRRYKVNVISTHQAGDHAPIVIEAHPSRANLLGRVEYGTIDGLPYTDHLMIRPGAFHRANGGYLVIDARDLTGERQAWEALKRTLHFGTIQMELNADGSEGPRSASLRPEPIESDMRVILIGPRKTYVGLAELDDEFLELFKVRADFDVEMERTAEHEQAYARYAGKVARDSASPALTAEAVARIILEGSRWAGDQDRLSTLFGDVHDLTTEACYWARKDGAPQTTAEHVVRAVKSRERRVGLPAERALYEQRENGQILIDTEGVVVGQINGLSVIQTIDGKYGAPTRITVRTAPGLAGVVNVEREIDHSGPIYDKGVYTLEGFLRGRFAMESPLGLTASITFEQEYDGVEGDSASSAELYALLSSLANVPIRQGLAVTGAVNQFGQVEVIGGVNEKIEGYFRLCQFRGLNGQQGVLIPRGNLRNLVLRDEVVEAVRAGRFHIYAVSHVDEGIELLTGVPAGRSGTDFRFPPGSINAQIVQALAAFNERVRVFGLAPALAPQRAR